MLQHDEPTEHLIQRLASDLRENHRKLKVGEPLNSQVRWTPHVVDESNQVAWHCMAELPESDFWLRRMQKAAEEVPKLRLGVCAPAHVLQAEEVLLALHNTGAVLATPVGDGEASPLSFLSSIPDFIYQQRLKLRAQTAEIILDRLLEQTGLAKSTKMKGVTLEIMTAVLLSQVDGFEVTSVGVSNRSQQMDVMVHNRNTAGALAGSEIVIAEAKNWTTPVGTTEYYSIYRKIGTRFGRSRLGFFVTTDRFTAGVEREMLRDSRHDILVVPLDRDVLPNLWRGIHSRNDDLTHRLEIATIEAASR